MRVVVLKSALTLLSLLAATNLAQVERVDGLTDTGISCQGLETLSSVSENLIKTKAQWDAFIEANPFVVVGAADSDCPGCCESEPILRDLRELTKGKNKLSYPEKHKKQKKIIRKEIQIARVDLQDKVLTEKLAERGVWFPMGTTILIGEKGRFTKYDGQYNSIEMLAHQMQRSINTVVTLTSEDSIM